MLHPSSGRSEHGAAWSSEMSVIYNITTWGHNPKDFDMDFYDLH